MASFALEFPDSAVLNLLGDDISVTDEGGTTTQLKGEFEYQYLEQELGNRLGIHHPTVIVNDEDAIYFERKYTVTFDGSDYQVLNKHSLGIGKTMIVLRSA